MPDNIGVFPGIRFQSYYCGTKLLKSLQIYENKSLS